MIQKLLLSFLFFLLSFLKIRSEKFSLKIAFLAIFMGFSFNIINAQCTKPSQPTPSTPTGPSSPCEGSTVSYSVTGSTNATSYSWFYPSDWQVVSGATTATITFIVGTSGNVGVYGVNACGRSDNSSQTNIQVVLKPATPSQPSSYNSTCNGFTAQWSTNGLTANYLVDVSTDPNFGNFIDGYHDFNAGNNQSVVLTGLISSTTYYYRVKRSTACGVSGYSASSSTTTTPGSTGGSVTGGSTICAGSNSGLLTLAGHTGTVQKWQSSVSPFSTWSDISNTQSTYTSGALSATTRFRAVVKDNSSCSSYSGYTTVTVNPSVAASVSIASSNTGAICAGTSVTFTATPTNGGTPTYQWKLNGVNVGTNAATFTSTSLANNDVVRCVMTSSLTSCVTGNPATSNGITMTVNPVLNASVSIASSTATTICTGTSVTFTATPTNGGTPSYQWKLNGVNVGTNSATYTTNTLANNNAITCVMTSNASPCLTGSPATSNSITMTVNANNTVTASSNPSICIGVNMTPITHTTTGATGIGTATNLPPGVTASWASNTITISGKPTSAGTYAYSIPLNGGCGTVNATGTITVSSESTIPTGITGTTSIISGSSTTLTVTGGSLGTGASAEWFTGSCGGVAAGTGNSITVSPTSTTTYYVRYKGTCNTTSCINVTVNVCIPQGDQTTSGNESWIGYVYKWTGTVPNPAVTNSPVNATTQYIGNVTEAKIFDRNMDAGAVNGATINICGTAPVDNFFVRYKMNVNLVDAGEYTFTIGGDDGTRLYIDGQLAVGRWNDHGYTPDEVKKTLTSGPHQFVLEYYENAGNARVSFTYGIPKGDPSVFGINTWNVYGYNASDISLPAASYAGTYVDSNLSFSTQTYWNKAQSPSYYAGWQGLAMPVDNFALSYKRQGFPCGNYKLDLANFDDDVEIYIDGTRIFNRSGYQTVTVPVGTYLLNKNSKVEVRLKENGGDANLALNFTLVPNVYNGTGPAPTGTTPITISSNMTLQSNLVVCSCTISPNVILTVPKDITLTVNENITVGAGGKLLIQNGGSLLQDNNSTTMFTGDITNSFEMQRTTQPVRRYDLTYWGTPVTAASNFTLKKLSPATLDDKYYSYNSVTDKFVPEYRGEAVMQPGKGYNVRAPQTYDITGAGVPYTASFIGIPNNGDIAVPVVGANWSLAGNPYPSAVDGKQFILDNGTNVGTLYFWTHATNPSTAYPGVDKYNYNTDDYALLNLTGNTQPAPSTPGGTPSSGFIAAGQGFFFKPSVTGNVLFTNSMRKVGNNTQFFKTAENNEIETNRVWLNLTNDSGAFKQMLVGYISGATNSYDNNYDAETSGSNAFIDFYTINDSRKLTIQGRTVPFDDTEVLPLGYKSSIAGDFTIAIDHADGLFTQQAVYLEDKVTGKIQNLTTGNYTFTTAIGSFAERFVLRYTNKTLGTGDFENLENTVLVSVKDKAIKVITSQEMIKDVAIFDITGKQLYDKTKVESNELQISNLQSSNQILLVRVTLENDFTTTKKIIFN